MHGKVWMFSNLIDDEDIEFMQHEFISYKQAMDYYEFGYKPIVRLISSVWGSVIGSAFFPHATKVNTQTRHKNIETYFFISILPHIVCLHHYNIAEQK